jgi:hypothetical protein
MTRILGTFHQESFSKTVNAVRDLLSVGSVLQPFD